MQCTNRCTNTWNEMLLKYLPDYLRYYDNDGFISHMENSQCVYTWGPFEKGLKKPTKRNICHSISFSRHHQLFLQDHFSCILFSFRKGKFSGLHLVPSGHFNTNSRRASRRRGKSNGSAGKFLDSIPSILRPKSRWCHKTFFSLLT